MGPDWWNQVMFPVYQTFEDDFELLQQKQLKKSKTKSEMEGKEEKEKENNSMMVKKGKGTKKGAYSSRELRNLLQDGTYQPKKWNNLQFEKQEELLDSLDKVLTKLKNYSDHSYPFLARVRKSDAPDYYDIISNPMDLSTMTKKLNKCEYTSKSEFQEDLRLIYSNCRTYNTDPSAKIYLQHADAMEKKGKELMKSVKNISGNEELGEESKGVEIESKPSKKKQKKEESEEEKESSEDSGMETSKIIDEESISSPKQEWDEELSSESKNNWGSSIISNTEDRLKLMSNRLEEGKIPFGERLANVRSGELMGVFSCLSSRLNAPHTLYHDGEQIQDEDEESQIIETLKKETESNKDFSAGFCPEISHFNSSIPDLPHQNEEESEHPKSNVNRQFARSLLQKHIGIISSSTSLEGIEFSSLEVLTDVMEDFFQQMARSFSISSNVRTKSIQLDTQLESSSLLDNQKFIELGLKQSLIPTSISQLVSFSKENQKLEE